MIYPPTRAVPKGHGDDADNVPDLMASSSSISSNHSSSVLNKSFNDSISSSFQPCCASSYRGSNVNPAFQNSGFFRRKLEKAAKIIQAVARGFLVRFEQMKAPFLLELEDVQKRRQEELEGIECLRRQEMETFRKDMDSQLRNLEAEIQELNSCIDYLKTENSRYSEDNMKLEMACKELRESNKKLRRDAKKDETPGKIKTLKREVGSLEAQRTAAEGIVKNYLGALETVERKINDFEVKGQLESRVKQRMAECIRDVIDTVERRDSHLAKKLRHLADKTNL